MKLSLVGIIVLWSIASSGAWAATQDGKFAIRGAGLIDCQTFLTEQKKRSPSYLMIGGWIDGYITGVNQQASATYDATSFESTELFVELIKNHCEKNPNDRLFPVMNSIVAQRWPHRLKQQSPLVGVTLDKQNTQIYRETILRIQNRLAEKGFYKGPANGQFDATTIAALAEFQKSLKGYKATGFPDQATLWELLAK